MNAENSKTRLEELSEKIDAISKIAAECLERCEKALKFARGEEK